MQTKHSLAEDALRVLGILGATETATAEDAAFVERVYDTKLAQWRRRGAVWWPNTGRLVAEIPDEAFPVLIDLLGNEIQGAFGRTQTVADKVAIEDGLLVRLGALKHRAPSGEQVPFSVY